MKIKPIIALTLALLCSASGLAYEIDDRDNAFADSIMQKGEFTVRGIIAPENGRKVSFGLHDPSGFKETIVHADDSGCFDTIIAITGPVQELHIYASGDIVPVHPGDTIVMNFLKDDFSIRGTTREDTRNLNFAVEIGRRMSKWFDRINAAKRKMPKEAFKYACVDSLNKGLLAAIDDYQNVWEEIQDSVEHAGGPLRDSEYFRLKGYLYPMTYLYSAPLISCINPERGKKLLPQGRSALMKEPTYKYLGSKYLGYHDYQYFIYSYLSGAASRAASMMSVSKKAEKYSNIKLCRLIAKDPLIAGWMDFCHGKSLFELPWRRAKDEIEYLCSTLSVNAFREELDSLIAETARWREGVEAPRFTFVGENGEKYHPEDFKGKYLYLDFWSMGCMPCRSEFKIMPEFKKEFAAYMDKMTIVTVCCGIESEADKKEWLNLCRKLSLDDLNTVIDVENSHPIYDLHAYPSYMLIDPEGKIVEIKAERPSLLLFLKKFGPTLLDETIGASSESISEASKNPGV